MNTATATTATRKYNVLLLMWPPWEGCRRIIRKFGT
jgi:hypothetical protein